MKDNFNTIIVLIIISLSFVNLQADITEGLIAHYPFNGDANDESGYGNHGVVQGATLSTDRFGNANSAYYFDGQSNYISISHSELIDFGEGESFSISGWFNTNVEYKYPKLLVKRRDTRTGYAISLYNTKLRFWGEGLNDNGFPSLLESPTSVLDDQWHHFVAIRDYGSNFKLYFDGVLAGTTYDNVGSISNQYDRIIGAYDSYQSSKWSFFKGKMDDIRFYDRTITEEEVQELCAGLNIGTVTINNTHPQSLNVSVDGDFSKFIQPGQSSGITLDNGQYSIDITSQNGYSWTYQIKIQNSEQISLTPQIFSPQEKIIYTSNRSGNVDIWICNPDGSDHEQLTDKPGREGSPRLSPDGSKVLYCYLYDGSYTLWIMDKDGSNNYQLTNHLSYGGVWSPDGSEILYCKETSYRRGNIKIINVDGSNDRVFFSPSSPHSLAIPYDWRHGKILFMASGSHSGLNKIFIMNDDGTNPVALTSHQSETGRINADGSKIVYGNNGHIRIMNLDGSENKLIINNSRRGNLAISPDGLKIAFTVGTSDDITNDNIAIVNIDGSNYRMLTYLYDLDGPSDWVYWNTSPIADAGDDITKEATSSNGAEVQLNGTGSNDPDGDNLTYRWAWAPDGEAFGSTPTATFPLGSTTVTLVVNDGSVDSKPDEVKVNIIDTTPPEISVTATPSVLWPPNHKMVPIHLTIQVSDIVDTSPTVVLESVESSEPDDAPGCGDEKAKNDIQDAELGTLDYDILLRAERTGKGNGRTYTIKYLVTDFSGNENSGTCTVNVPHNLGKLTPEELAIISTPVQFVLSQNYPNPFNPSTTIRYYIPTDCIMKLEIYNYNGQKIDELINGNKSAGFYETQWNANVTSGVYFYRFEAIPVDNSKKSFVEIRKMILTR